MSNRESKIAIFKAALCYGFAIALRALFLVIRRCDFFSRTHERTPDKEQNLLESLQTNTKKSKNHESLIDRILSKLKGADDSILQQVMSKITNGVKTAGIVASTIASQ